MRKGDEYFNIWPVYDWQKISGTTILQRSHLPGADSIQMEGLTDFVGAVTDGLYGAVAFDFRSPHDLVAAKKSWFFFDHEYVCIGTDIHSTRNLPVVTTMNQTLLRSDVTVMQDGPAARLPRGDRELKDVKCVYQDGVGYIFPMPATVHLSNQTEHGRWSDITAQKNISQEVVDMDVFKLWIDHGKRPQDAAYEYVVVPDVREQELFSADGLDRGIEILSKTSDIHAVVNRKLGLCQMAFYKSGEVKISDGLSVGMESQGMAMVRINANKVTELTVADPSRKLNSVMVTLSGIYQAKGDHFLAIPDSGKGVTRIIVDLPQGVYAGKSITIALK
jgi:chondroitin AC lyase